MSQGYFSDFLPTRPPVDSLLEIQYLVQVPFIIIKRKPLKKFKYLKIVFEYSHIAIVYLVLPKLLYYFCFYVPLTFFAKMIGFIQESTSLS